MSAEAGRAVPAMRILEPTASPSAWHGYRLETAMPLAFDERPWLSSFVESLVDVIGRVYQLQPSLWLDTAELHRDGGARLLSSHARQWSPTMGFGFDPTGPSPRTLQFSDLAEATYGTPPKISTAPPSLSLP